MSRWLLWVPLAAFALLALVAVIGLRKPENGVIASQMVGQTVPAFAAPAMLPGKPGVASAGLRGGVHLVNVFASWCLPCATEAPQLAAIASLGVPIEGVAVRDRADDLRGFLQRNGDPYRAIGGDPDSRIQLALGSSGVPETFVVDGQGIIRAQHIGPIGPEDLDEILGAAGLGRR